MTSNLVTDRNGARVSIDPTLVANLIETHTDHTSALEHQLHQAQGAWLELVKAAFGPDATTALTQVREILQRHSNPDFLHAITGRDNRSLEHD
jgi:hypothetical protein